VFPVSNGNAERKECNGCKFVAVNAGEMAATVKQDSDAMGKTIAEISLNAALREDFF